MKKSLSYRIGKFFGGLPIFGKIIFLGLLLAGIFWIFSTSATSSAEDAFPFGELIIFFAILYILIKSIISVFRKSEHAQHEAQTICPNCGTRAEPEDFGKGNRFIEVILWLCLIIPGLIYSIWRRSGNQAGCPSCGQTGMINVTTPHGRLLVEKLRAIPVPDPSVL